MKSGESGNKIHEIILKYRYVRHNARAVLTEGNGTFVLGEGTQLLISKVEKGVRLQLEVNGTIFYVNKLLSGKAQVIHYMSGGVERTYTYGVGYQPSILHGWFDKQ